jgi:hypothetical protein
MSDDRLAPIVMMSFYIKVRVGAVGGGSAP